MVHRGDLTPTVVDGVERFDPAQVAELLVEDERIPAEVQLLNAATAMARQAESHSQCMIDLLASPSAEILRVLQQENQALREQRDRVVTENERWRGKQHEFELERMQLEHEQARKTRKLDMLKSILQQYAPFIQAAIAQHIRASAQPASPASPAPADESSGLPTDSAPMKSAAPSGASGAGLSESELELIDAALEAFSQAGPEALAEFLRRFREQQGGGNDGNPAKS
jgi:hypothetical protein